MVYKAILPIGDYKVGDTVPEALALTWLAQYDAPHVEEVKKGNKSDKKSQEKADKESDEKIKDDASKEDADPSAMFDDYLNRNTNVVISNIKKDKLSNDTINKLSEMESKNKNRSKILTALNNKLRG